MGVDSVQSFLERVKSQRADLVRFLLVSTFLCINFSLLSNVLTLESTDTSGMQGS